MPKKTKTTRRIQRGGMKLPKLLLAAGIVLTFVGTACGLKHIITACAGNTCRSPVAEHQIKAFYPETDVSVISRGANVRMPGAPMAPKSKTFAASYCKYGDLKCLEGVDSHHSTQFECEEILDLIQKNGSDTVQIIPMDDLVATQINAALKKCSLTHAQKRRISVGLDCQDGVCKKLSAEIPDPFFDRGTPNEVPAYNKMEKMVSDVLKTEFNNCRKTRSTSRNNSKALIRRSSSADAIPRPQSKTKSRPKPKSKSRPKSR